MHFRRLSRPPDEDTAARARARVAQLSPAGRDRGGAADDGLGAAGMVKDAPGGQWDGWPGLGRLDGGAAGSPVPLPGGRSEVRSSWLEPIRDRLPLWLRGARVGFDRAHVAVIGLVLVVGVVAASVFFMAGRPNIIPVDHEVVETGTPLNQAADADQMVNDGPRAGAGRAGSEVVAGEGSAGAVTSMMVHVAGLVVEPGVVELPSGARVIDAIEAAGGPTSDADLTPLNLARILNDGEQVLVTSEPVAVRRGTSGGGGPGSTGDGHLVSLNTADAADLEMLPGIGPALAERILDWRERNGRFSSIDELREISGIGERRFTEIEPQVTL